jgi:hypothetical protein
MDDFRLADNHALAVGARALAVVCALAIMVASLGPSTWLPHLLYSNNLEHFAAFYVVALAFYAARYRTPLLRVVRDVVLLATALEAVRWILPGPRPASFQHWVADLGGCLAAVAPMLVSDFRGHFHRNAPAGGES